MFLRLFRYIIPFLPSLSLLLFFPRLLSPSLRFLRLFLSRTPSRLSSPTQFDSRRQKRVVVNNVLKVVCPRQHIAKVNPDSLAETVRFVHQSRIYSIGYGYLNRLEILLTLRIILFTNWLVKTFYSLQNYFWRTILSPFPYL